MSRDPWRVSLHGGHSGEFCEHAAGTLRRVLEAAIAAGYHTFGVSEHVARTDDRFLYDTEVAKGYDAAQLTANFHAYGAAVDALSHELADRLIVLRGFEAEVVPSAAYAAETQAWRDRYPFDYIVGSVHYVNEHVIDGTVAQYERAAEVAGGLEALFVGYYELVAELVATLVPDVVGHLDLIRKNAPAAYAGPPPTAAIDRAVNRALEAVREADGILDLNTAAYRKGMATPYPAPWLVERARDMDIAFCLGDDSHGPDQVGMGIEQGRAYLLQHGVTHVTVLTREHPDPVSPAIRRRVPLS